jgi:hypothetical protein
MENALAADNDNVYQGSWAFRVRRDWQALGLAGAVGSAFGAERALLASVTGHYSFPAVGEGLQRFVSGVLVDATPVAMDEGGNVTTLSAGVALGGEFDSVMAGVGIHVMASARVGQMLNEAPAADETYFGAALAGSFGIMRRFALFAQLDYASVSPREGDAAFTFGSGLRMRIGPGK